MALIWSAGIVNIHPRSSTTATESERSPIVLFMEDLLSAQRGPGQALHPLVRQNVPDSEQLNVESLENYQQTRRVVEDFTALTLATIPTEFGKLLYLSSLRDLATGCYVHDGLAARYSQEAVQQALGYCHEQLFLRILELPMEQQERDLCACIEGMEGEFWAKLGRWRETEFYRLMVPSDSPGYLKEVFLANVGAMLDLVLQEHARRDPAASPALPPAQ